MSNLLISTIILKFAYSSEYLTNSDRARNVDNPLSWGFLYFVFEHLTITINVRF